MTMQPPDTSWLHGEYGEECYSFIYVRATPEQVVTRLGGGWQDFTPGPFPDDPDHYPCYGDPLGVTSIGDWTFVFDPDWLCSLFEVDPESRVECGLDTLESIYSGHPRMGIWIGPHAPGWTHLFAFNLYSHPLGFPNPGKRRVFEIDYTGEVGPGLSPLYLHYDGEIIGDVTPPQEPGEPVDLPDYQPPTEGLELGGHDTYDEDLHSYFCMMGRVTGRFTNREWWTATRAFYCIPTKTKPYDGPFASLL